VNFTGVIFVVFNKQLKFYHYRIDNGKTLP